MKFDIEFVNELLFYLEIQDQGEGVLFSDHEYLVRHGFDTNHLKEHLQNRDLTAVTRFHLKKMEESGLVEESNAYAECSTFSLTILGHEEIQRLRDNTLTKRFRKLLAQWGDKAMSSIVLPIIVSVLTVLILNYLGIAQSANPTP